MKNNKHEVSIIRSSAAEYLTFITATGEGDVNAIYSDENVWLTQKMMGVLYNVETNTINYHLKKIFMDKEVDENSVIRKFRITAALSKITDIYATSIDYDAHSLTTKNSSQEYRINRISCIKVILIKY